MIDKINQQLLDTTIFLIANIVHIAIAFMFIARAQRFNRRANVAGNASVAMIFPFGAAVMLNSLVSRDWWMIVLPTFLLAFLVLELLIDYILRLDFRNTRWLWPYLLLYYLGLNATIAYTFHVGELYGSITLFTYILNLMAIWYSFVRFERIPVRSI